MNMKLVLGAVGAITALGGGGGGAYYYMAGGGAAAGAEQVAEESSEATGDPVYLPLDTLAAPVMRGNKVRQYVFLNVSLQIIDLENKAEVAILKPKIQDILLRELHRRSIISPGKGEQIDFVALKQRLLRQVRTVIAPGIVQDVLITNAMMGAKS